MSSISHSVLSLASTIPPGESARVVTTSLTTFRPERLIVSPGSFPLKPLTMTRNLRNIGG